MVRAPLIALTLASVLLMACSSASNGGSDPPTAMAHASDSAPSVDEILQRLNERYASAKTYSDEGTLHEMLGRRGQARHEITAQIRTRWVAASKSMHFDFQSKDAFSNDRLAIWSRDGATKSLFLGELRTDPSLQMALAALHGVSQGTTGLIPRWLHDGQAGTRLKYDLHGERACRPAVTCFVLVGRHDRGTVELGIDTKTFALRTYATEYTIVRAPEEAQKMFDELKPEMRKQVGDGFVERMKAPLDVEETLVLDPIFDEPIAPSTFDAFDATTNP